MQMRCCSWMRITPLHLEHTATQQQPMADPLVAKQANQQQQRRRVPLRGRTGIIPTGMIQAMRLQGTRHQQQHTPKPRHLLLQQCGNLHHRQQRRRQQQPPRSCHGRQLRNQPRLRPRGVPGPGHLQRLQHQQQQQPRHHPQPPPPGYRRTLTIDLCADIMVMMQSWLILRHKQ